MSLGEESESVICELGIESNIAVSLNTSEVIHRVFGTGLGNFTDHSDGDYLSRIIFLLNPSQPISTFLFINLFN